MNGRKARAETGGKQTAKGSGGTAEKQIEALHVQLMEATLKHDPGFLEKYLADDYMAIRNDGKLTTKVQEIDNYKSHVTKYESIEINGKPFSGDVRNTRVWVKQGGNWKIVAFQATQVAPASE